jgi:hypothetical protein
LLFLHSRETDDFSSYLLTPSKNIADEQPGRAGRTPLLILGKQASALTTGAYQSETIFSRH